jgi:hypothetical protein
VTEDAAPPSAHFEPLRPASRKRLILGLVLGPILWLVAFVVTAIVVHYSYAIAIGLIVAVAAMITALAALALLKWGREREEGRYVDGG